MRKRVEGIIKHPLISGSSIIFIGTFFANILNYFFNLLMGRFLTVSDYGLVVSLSSIIIILSLFQTTLANIFAKFSASYYASKNESKMRLLLGGGLRFVFLAAILLSGFFVLCFPFIASFLKINNLLLLILVSGYSFAAIIYALPYGVLQGEMKFNFLTVLNILSSIAKIFFGIVLIVLGWGVIGAISGYFLSISIPLLIALFVILKHHKVLNNKHGSLKLFISEFKKYSLHFLLASIGISIFNSMDTILVRHLFAPVIAGQYAALSLMGRSIFYFTFPIYFVFFPLIAQKRELKENTISTLLLAAGIVLSSSVILSFFYFINPQFVLNIFFPAKGYKILTSYLGPFSVFITIFSVAFLFHNFLLSIGKTGIYKINLLCGTLLIILSFVFHSTLNQIIIILILTSLLLLISLFIYYLYHGKD